MTTISRRQFGLGSLLALGAMSTQACRSVAFAGPEPQAPDASAIIPDPLSYVDPELREIAERALQFSTPREWSVEMLMSQRGGGAAFAPPVLPDVPVYEEMVPVGDGHPDVRIFVINAQAGAKRPAILHIHGGGYILAKAEWEIGHLQPVAKALDCAIVTVDYRLAPETRYTGSVEDNYAGLLWLYRNAKQIGVDPDKIALMGESAGGGHAALLAIAARDRGEVPLVLQALVYPMLDDRTGSTRNPPAHIGTIGWDRASNRFAWECFLGTKPGGPDVPVAGVPARQPNLAGLAPAFIGVGGIDLFVQEDIEYAQRLTEAGVLTQLHVSPGAFHGFDRFAANTGIGRTFNNAKMNALRRAFDQPVEI